MSTAPSDPYPYPTPNSVLVPSLALQKHFEGGYFSQTVCLESALPKAGDTATSVGGLPPSAALGGKVQQPWGPGAALLGGGPKEGEPGMSGGGVDATQIYYLLTGGSYRGKMHMNLHSHFHLLHSGRALYTLIRPPTSPTSLPEVHRVVLGHNIAAGETPQLFVPGGWWKASEIPEEDMLLLDAPGAKDRGLDDRIGCLISEIVVPGWNPDQHIFIDEDKLKDMWHGDAGWEKYKIYLSSA